MQFIFITFFAFLLLIQPLSACTNVLVTKGASADGSVMITYTADQAGLFASLDLFPAADYAADAVVEISGKGSIPQVQHTFHVIGSIGQGCINEHQLAMAETTFGGREELENPDGFFKYEQLMTLGLQRAKTAREAIDIMTKLVDEYGYADVGESISIADTNEAWVLEIIGTGKGGKSAIWVALKVPDGQISAHANQARIGEFPLNDPANCIYSPNVISFAVEKGWHDPNAGKPFDFAEIYDPPTVKSKRVCATRVWSVFRRAAPSQHFSADYHRGAPDAKKYPWAITPDRKLSVADVMGLMRDHYEGTDFDMTQGIDAGAYGLPRRWRPLYFKNPDNEAEEFSWERPISTQQTAFSFVTQSRSWLPDAIGGILWFGFDDSYLTCYFPLYCSTDKLPKSCIGGSSAVFSPDKIWWLFNNVSNYANLMYSAMQPEITAVQKELESQFFALQSPVEKAALELSATNPNLMRTYLTDYSVRGVDKVVARWQELAEHLYVKYNDGYTRTPDSKFPDVGYPKSWLKRVIQDRGNDFKLP